MLLKKRFIVTNSGRDGGRTKLLANHKYNLETDFLHGPSPRVETLG